MSLTRFAPLFVVALLGLLISATTADAARVKRSSVKCAQTHTVPAGGNLAKVERATLCLLNGERKRRGMSALRTNRRLAKVADRHTVDMVKHGYFAHDSRNGRSFSDRIRAAGYLTRVGQWTIGENLGWGSGSKGSAAEMVKAWMASPGHRANILNRRFREIGIGLTLGSPRGGDGATYATEFGAVTRVARRS
jgi:uncharacterized protein YkwD